MRTQLAILLGKSISKTTRFLKIGGGSAAPGLYALKIDPNLVERLISKIPTNIIITGTNGKTTTARMLAHFARAIGLKVVRNHTGSNLERGIASTILQHSKLHLRGVRTNFDVGIWELDEAAFNSVAPKINPKVVVFLNVFRDQLDRYGEIDTVVKKWKEALKKLDQEMIVLVNGDDANTNKLTKDFKGKVQKFGVEGYKIIGESIIHKREKENLDFEAKNIEIRGLTGTSFILDFHHLSSIIHLPVPGIYHIYDFLAAFAAGQNLGFDSKKMISSLKNFSPAFGRVEKFALQPRRLQVGVRLQDKLDGYIFLIKNPAGATQVFETIAPSLKKNDRLLLALNDNLADGTDVSWIWDVGFEVLQNPSRVKTRNLEIIVSGSRAYDLANRLKYAGLDSNKIITEPDLETAFKRAERDLKGRLFILPTYTAMLDLQKILAKSGIKKNYWEEE